MSLFPVVSSCLSLFSSLWLRGICARLTLPCLFLSRLDLCSFPSSLTTRSVGFMLVSHTGDTQRGRISRASLCSLSNSPTPLHRLDLFSFPTPAFSRGNSYAGQTCARFKHVWLSTLPPPAPEPLMRPIPKPLMRPIPTPH